MSHIFISYGQNGIAGGDLKDIPVVIPPLKEQQRIVEMVERRLSVADEIEKKLDGEPPCGDDMVHAERSRACPDSQGDVGRSILKSAFEGKL